MKIRISNIVNFVILLLVTFPILPTIARGGVKEEIQKNIADIDSKISEIRALTDTLTTTQKDLKKQLVQDVEDVNSKLLDPQIKNISHSISNVNKVPSSILNLANIGDLPSVLKKTKDSLNTTKKMIANIREHFDDEIVEDFDPQLDAKEIYKELGLAIEGLEKVKEKLIKTRDTWSVGIINWIGY